MPAAAAPRIDRAARVIAAPVSVLWQAWFGAGNLVQWLPPVGMRGEVLAFEPWPGGAFDMRLTYAEPGPGKADAGSDLVLGRFVRIETERRFELSVRFPSDDPAFAGEMRMEWEFLPVGGGTEVRITARDVPPGIGAEDHAQGLAASLANLVRFVE